MKKVCKNGHSYFKSSDCPTCPICESERRPLAEFLTLLPAPARRALEREGLLTLEALSQFSEKEMLKLHGMGPSSIPKLRKLLMESGMEFRKV